MFKKIMVPVDLAHLDTLERPLDLAAKLSKFWDAPIVYVGVTAGTPSDVAHTPEEFEAKLDDFVRLESRKHSLHEPEAVSRMSHDPAIDLNKVLLETIEDTGADLVIMGSHKPGMREHVFASHGGYVSSHAGVSVLVVR